MPRLRVRQEQMHQGIGSSTKYAPPSNDPNRRPRAGLEKPSSSWVRSSSSLPRPAQSRAAVEQRSAARRMSSRNYSAHHTTADAVLMVAVAAVISRGDAVDMPLDSRPVSSSRSANSKSEKNRKGLNRRQRRGGADQHAIRLLPGSSQVMPPG